MGLSHLFFSLRMHFDFWWSTGFGVEFCGRIQGSIPISFYKQPFHSNLTQFRRFMWLFLCWCYCAAFIAVDWKNKWVLFDSGVSVPSQFRGTEAFSSEGQLVMKAIGGGFGFTRWTILTSWNDSVFAHGLLYSKSPGARSRTWINRFEIFIHEKTHSNGRSFSRVFCRTDFIKAKFNIFRFRFFHKLQNFLPENTVNTKRMKWQKKYIIPSL